MFSWRNNFSSDKINIRRFLNPSFPLGTQISVLKAQFLHKHSSHIATEYISKRASQQAGGDIFFNSAGNAKIKIHASPSLNKTTERRRSDDLEKLIKEIGTKPCAYS